MDYDLTDIPTGYDRGREHGPEFLDLWMNKIESHSDGQRINDILDLGCGTGRFSEGLAARFDVKVIGIDPSKKMLERARAKKLDDRVQLSQDSLQKMFSDKRNIFVCVMMNDDIKAVDPAVFMFLEVMMQL